MKTVYISIGNSDDKLTQKEWRRFAQETEGLLDRFSAQRHGTWFSRPDSVWQNMCTCAVLEDEDVRYVRDELSLIAKAWRQDSIAMAVVDEVEMVTP